jgi:hypothetical protein
MIGSIGLTSGIMVEKYSWIVKQANSAISRRASNIQQAQSEL